MSEAVNKYCWMKKIRKYHLNTSRATGYEHNVKHDGKHRYSLEWKTIDKYKLLYCSKYIEIQVHISRRHIIRHTDKVTEEKWEKIYILQRYLTLYSGTERLEVLYNKKTQKISFGFELRNR